MAEVYDIESFRERREPPPGRFSAFKPGDVVSADRRIGEVTAYEGVAQGSDLFRVAWDDGTSCPAVHDGLVLATAEERAAYVERRIDDQPEPSVRP